MTFRGRIPSACAPSVVFTPNSSAGLTLVEVMMAAILLVVGFVGLIEAVTLVSGMMDHARRQTLANQIINHEMAQLRLLDWTDLNALPTNSTALGMPYSSGTTYYVGDTVTSGGVWYRCTQQSSGSSPSSNSTAWNVDNPPYANEFSTPTSGVAYGATFTVARSASTPITNLREVVITVTWTVRTSRLDSTGNPLTFTFRRSNAAWFGKYGLDLMLQR